MNTHYILFDTADALFPDVIREKIKRFGYYDAVDEIIRNSKVLDREGEVFVKCTARILTNFKMTRSGPFKGVEILINGDINGKKILIDCWDMIGDQLLEINKSVRESSYSRDRYLVELGTSERNQLIAKIWHMTKQLLPITMGDTSYGLVGASKILFAVLPEIVLPIDNRQWLKVFQTVDLGDVISRMVREIQDWEKATNEKLNEMDIEKKLTTLPAVYNVMAMEARLKKTAGE